MPSIGITLAGWRHGACDAAVVGRRLRSPVHADGSECFSAARMRLSPDTAANTARGEAAVRAVCTVSKTVPPVCLADEHPLRLPTTISADTLDKVVWGDQPEYLAAFAVRPMSPPSGDTRERREPSDQLAFSSRYEIKSRGVSSSANFSGGIWVPNSSFMSFQKAITSVDYTPASTMLRPRLMGSPSDLSSIWRLASTMA